MSREQLIEDRLEEIDRDIQNLVIKELGYRQCDGYIGENADRENA